MFKISSNGFSAQPRISCILNFSRSVVMYFCKILVKLLLAVVNLALAFPLRYFLIIDTGSYSICYILVLDESFLIEYN